MDLVFDICRSLLDMGIEKPAILDCHGWLDGPLDTVSQELCNATDKGVAIIKPLFMANDELNAVRESPGRGEHSTGAGLKRPGSWTLVRMLCIYRKRQKLPIWVPL